MTTNFSRFSGLAALAILLLPFLSTSQVSVPGKPYILRFKDRIPASVLNNVPTETMPAIDLEALEAQDKLDEANGVPPRFGKGFEVSYNLNDHGRWDRLPNGDRVWRLRIVSQEALSISLTYDDFHMPKGGRLYIYNQDFSHIIGSYTAENNRPNGTFASGLVYGDTITLGYYEPRRVRGEGRISVASVVHGYRNVPRPDPKDFGIDISAERVTNNDCNLDAACSQGDSWRNQIKSIGLMVLNDGNDTRYCTGTLVANTSGSTKPLFLTANSCLLGTDAVTSPNDNLIIYWNYVAPSCEGPDPGLAGLSSSLGATVLANNTPAGLVTGSDFAIMELNNNPADLGYDIFYSGWDATTTVSPTAVTSIHHYEGEVLQLAIRNSAPNVTQYNADTPSPSGPTAFWQVDWDNGVLDFNGSPLFDNATNRMIGTYSGGSATCSGLIQGNGFDYFGQLSYGWNNNGAATATRRLRDHLDPNNTGTRVIDGYGPDALDCNDPVVLDCATTYSGNTSIARNNITEYDGTSGYVGREIVHTFTPSATGDYTFDVTNLSANLDLFLLTSCDPANAVIASNTNGGTANESITSTLTVGQTYFIIVDGAVDGTYDLSVTCPTPCSIATTIFCGTPVNGSNAGAQNVNTDYGSSMSGAYVGGEVVYSFTTVGGKTIFDFDNLTADLDWFLLSDCQDPTGSLVAQNIQNDAGSGSTVTINELPGGTYFLVIDSRGQVGSYTITITCPVNGTCTMPNAILDGQTLSGNTADGQNQFSQYGSQTGLTGNELVYSFSTDINGPATFTITNLSTDLDIFLLNTSCDPVNNLLASSTNFGLTDESITATIFAGVTYLLIVDGVGTLPGTFDVSADGPVPCDLPDMVTCEDPNAPFIFGINGSTVGQTSYYDTYSTSGNYTGGDLVYEVTADAGELTIVLDPTSDDLDIFLLDTCDPPNGELARSINFGLANDTIKATIADGTYFIVVDGVSNGESDFNLQIICNQPTVEIAIKTFLQGPYDGTTMTDALRPQLSTTEPFTSLGYSRVGISTQETINPTVLNTTGNDAISDWVLVELRDPTNNDVILKNQAALLQRDGDVVDLDGISPVRIQIDPGDYFVVIRSINHLDVMTAGVVTLTQ